MQGSLTAITDTWSHALMFLSFVGGVVTWIVALVLFLRISNELQRARQTGEDIGIPRNVRGLPYFVIFTKGLLPRVERERRLLIWAIIAFTGFWFAGVLLAGTQGPSPARAKQSCTHLPCTNANAAERNRERTRTDPD